MSAFIEAHKTKKTGSGGIKAITFQKRQKGMKRLEKQRMKEERRTQKKFEKRAKEEAAKENSAVLSNTETVN